MEFRSEPYINKLYFEKGEASQEYYSDRSYLPEVIKTLAETCLKLRPDVCSGLIFWSPLNVNVNYEEEHILFKSDYTPLDGYHSIVEVLSEK